MSRIVGRYIDGSYRAQCAKCGIENDIIDMVEMPLQVAGGAFSGKWICRRHQVKHQPRNDIPLYDLTDDFEGDVQQPRAVEDISTAVPVPTVTSISPSSSSVAALLAAPTLTVTGTNFRRSLPRSVVRWAGLLLSGTTFVSTTSLTVVVPPDIIAAGTIAIDVQNVGPPHIAGSGVSPTANVSNSTNLVLT